jgi:probable HAF family extracellular repeat protein
MPSRGLRSHSIAKKAQSGGATFGLKTHMHNGGNMQARRLTYFTAMAVFAALAVPVRFAQAQQKRSQPPKYYVFNLGAPLGGGAEAVGINNLGWISGGANLTGNNVVNAELWIGSPLDLGTLGGPNSNVSWPNHTIKGEIVGIAETAQPNPYGEPWSCFAFFPSATPTGDVCVGFAWQDGVMTELPPLTGGYDSYAAGVNNRGQVVGWAEDGVHDPTCNAPGQVLQFEAVIWGPKLTAITQLPPYPGDPDSAATAINDQGQVVGISGLCSNAVGGASAEHALLWENGKPINLGNIGGEAWNTPVSLNNHGQIVGFANTSGDQNAGLSPTAFLWTQTTGMQALPFLDGDKNSIAFDINEKGQVVGQSAGPNDGPIGLRAFLYENGVMMDLNSLIQPDSSLYLTNAQGINDRGEIAGTALDASGVAVAFLAVRAYGGESQASPSRAKALANGSKLLPENVTRQQTGFTRLAFGASGTR